MSSVFLYSVDKGKKRFGYYVFLPKKFEIPTTSKVHCATAALEEFVDALKSKDTIPFTSKAVNDAIIALKNIIAPNRSENKKDISAPRVNMMLPKQNDATLPRVPQTEDAALSRVRRLSILAQKNANKCHLQIYSRGMNVYKKFGTKYHRGIIRDFDAKEGYYKVKNNDGDTEEYTKEEIKNMLHKSDESNMQESMKVTRHERVEANYCKIQLEYNPKNVGSVARWSNAMNWIEYQ